MYFGMQWINMKKTLFIVMKALKGKGPRILFGQF
jgi:hypothetical protein